MGSAQGDPPVARWPVGAAIGVLAGAVAIGTATLAAGLIGTGTAPVLAVGGAAVDASPEWLKRFAIDTFGTDDKTALLLGIGIVLTIAAIVLGIMSLRRPRAAQPREWAVVPACAPIVLLDWFGSDRGGTRCCGRRSRCAKD